MGRRNASSIQFKRAQWMLDLAYFSGMTLLQVLLAILFPPLAVLDRGCGSILIVLLLTACGWVPGVIAALVILNKNG